MRRIPKQLIYETNPKPENRQEFFPQWTKYPEKTINLLSILLFLKDSSFIVKLSYFNIRLLHSHDPYSVT